MNCLMKNRKTGIVTFPKVLINAIFLNFNESIEQLVALLRHHIRYCAKFPIRIIIPYQCLFHVKDHLQSDVVFCIGLVQ